MCGFCPSRIAGPCAGATFKTHRNDEGSGFPSRFPNYRSCEGPFDQILQPYYMFAWKWGMLQDCYSNEKIMINQYKPQDFEETYVLTSPYLPIIHKKSLDFLEATHFIQDMIGNDKADQDNFRKNTILNLPGNSFTAASEMWHYVSVK